MNSYEKALRAQQKADEADRKINKAFGIKPKSPTRNPYARSYSHFNPAPKNNQEVRNNINARILDILSGKNANKSNRENFKMGRSSAY